MKHLLCIAAIFLSVSAFSQTKPKTYFTGNANVTRHDKKLLKDSVARVKDSTAKDTAAAAEPKYRYLAIDAPHWEYLVDVIRHNSEMSAADTEDYIEFLSKSLIRERPKPKK